MRMRRTLITVILAIALIALVGCGGDDSDSQSATNASSNGDSSASMNNDSSDANGNTSSSEDLAKKKFDVSWRDALKKARDDFSGDVSKIELERSDRGNYHYKVELISDTEEYDIQVDANSGKVLTKDRDELDSDERRTERKKKGIDLDKVISLDKAMNAALKVHDGPINKWKLEGKSRGPQYEFDIDKPSGGGDWEVQIDAKSGKVIQDD